MGNLNSLGSLGRMVLLSCGAALVACVLAATASAAAVTPTSLTDCGGKVSADPGGAAADEPNLLDYRFSCDGGITAYTILIQQQGDPGGSIDDYNPAPSVFETDGLTPSPSESVTCEGTTPSGGINCNTGTQGVQISDGFFVAGSVDPIQAYCKHLPTNANGKTAKAGTPAIPQAVVQLVVTDYTGAEDGPFNLGPAKACAKVPNVVPTPKPKPKTKTKTKSKTKKTTSVPKHA
ncbi:MAG TPA: hypothetical protein VMF14_14100 [Solirubrobacteraceae bacterium]|nr:hypothetical protein [Solirubrobacteraceae bacterium]